MIYLVIYLSIYLVLTPTGAVGLELAAATASEHQPGRGQLCASEDPSPTELARQLAPLGETGRQALVALAGSSNPDEVLCGIAGLAALGDRRVISPLASALENPTLRPAAYKLARWAAYLAGGPEPDLGAAMLRVVEAVSDQATWDATGIDAIWLLGEVDHPAARDRLLTELRLPLSPEALDAVVHGLARQGDPRARTAIATLGVEAARAKSGNATPEQARRLGEVAFYQLALGPDALAEGLVTLGTMAARDQESAAAWAVQTLCARAVRRPAARAPIEAHQQALVGELDRLGISWQASKGPLGCGTH